jgi:pantoate kinase
MRAHAPGSVTTMFRPAEDASYGVSLATADGTVATVEESSRTRISLDGEAAEMPPVEIALRELGVSAAVSLETELPIGSGFGISGASTLATVIAANAELELGHDREHLLDIAHRAEVEAGTGLGDVFVQDRGGLVWNVGDGIQSTELEATLQYTTFGGIETASVLGDDRTLGRVREAADAHLHEFDPGAGIAPLLDLSWAFADATGLPTDPVRETVESIQRESGSATMAMVGETVIATGGGDILDGSTTVATRGAHLLE